jgi:hypothetical protein
MIERHISGPDCQRNLDLLIDRKWTNFCGYQMGVSLSAGDGNFSTDDVLQWARKWPAHRLIVVRGMHSDAAPRIAKVQRERDEKKGVKVQRERAAKQPQSEPNAGREGYSGEPEKATNQDVQNYIMAAAKRFHIDRKKALAVARAEGLGGFDPSTGHWSNGPNDGGTSFGPFQLHRAPDGRALGDQFEKQTGLKLSDMKNWRAGVDFALKDAARHGWSPWSSQRGRPRFEGIDWQAVQSDMQRPAPSAAPHAGPRINLGTGDRVPTEALRIPLSGGREPPG